MWDDPIVQEVRSTRERLAAELDFNVHAIFADLQDRQRRLGRRLVQRGRKPGSEQAAAPDRDSPALHPGR